MEEKTRAIINCETLESTVKANTLQIWRVYTLNNRNNLLAGFTYQDYFYDYDAAVQYCDRQGFEIFLTLE